MRRSVLSFLGVAGVALALTMSAGADQNYTDPNGDGQSGTDIVSVTVRNDASGNISIQVGSASQIVANHAIAIFIDADRNQSTGCQGDEYWMFGGPVVGTAFYACSGGSFAQATPADYHAGIAASNVTEFRFSRGDLGNVSGFNFVVMSISIDPPNINFWDVAPDSGYWSYDLTTPATTTTTTTTTTPPPPPPPPVAVAKPVIGAPVITPVHPKAGGTVTVKFHVTRSDTGAAMKTGKMVCDPSIAGKVIQHAESFTGGIAKLTFTVPKTAKGKVVKVKVTIKANGKSATRIASFKVS